MQLGIMPLEHFALPYQLLQDHQRQLVSSVGKQNDKAGLTHEWLNIPIHIFGMVGYSEATHGGVGLT